MNGDIRTLNNHASEMRKQTLAIINNIDEDKQSQNFIKSIFFQILMKLFDFTIVLLRYSTIC